MCNKLLLEEKRNSKKSNCHDEATYIAHYSQTNDNSLAMKIKKFQFSEKQF